MCSIAGSTVSFTAVGTCKVSANQAGNANYEPAAQAQQSFAVAKGDQAIALAALADKRFDESPVTVGATATSGWRWRSRRRRRLCARFRGRA